MTISKLLSKQYAQSLKTLDESYLISVAETISADSASRTHFGLRDIAELGELIKYLDLIIHIFVRKSIMIT